MYTESTLYYLDGSSNIIDISSNMLTNIIISNNVLFHNQTSIEDISGVEIGTNVTKIEDNTFQSCSNLQYIKIYNTDILTYIGNNIFEDICGNGVYYFYSNNNYYTSNIIKLISLLPPMWVNGLDISYNYYTDFSVLCNNLNIETDNTLYYYFKPIDISYQDFHSLFFYNNSYFNLNKWYSINNIDSSNLEKYTVINKQLERIYSYENSSSDISFNLLSKIITHYQYYIPKQCWSINSSICLTKKISKFKTIYDLDNKCRSNCNCSCKITIDDFFNMFEAQGIEMAVDNSFNHIPVLAKGLPVDASTVKYTAILHLFFKSNNSNVFNLSLKMPYLIDFSSSMPTSSIANTNNYRYNPYYIQ